MNISYGGNMWIGMPHLRKQFITKPFLYQYTPELRYGVIRILGFMWWIYK